MHSQKDCNGYFYEFGRLFRGLREALKGRFMRLLGLLLLFALPAAAVNAVNCNRLAQAAVSVLPELDFASSNAAQQLLSALANASQQSAADYLLSLLTAFLQCAMLIFAAVFTGEAAAHPNKKPDASVMAKTIIRRLPAVFLILYLSSFIQSLLLQLSLSVCVMALLLPVIYIALPAAALFAFVLTSVSTALVDSYSSVLIASTSLGRVRFMFSLLYSRLLLRGNFIKTVVYYTIICAVSSIIFALPAVGAAALSLSGSPWAVAGWGAAALVQTMLAGISMCIYTGRMLQLEQKNAAALKQFTFITGNGDSNGDAEN